jgi:hypothetical protein
MTALLAELATSIAVAAGMMAFIACAAIGGFRP